MLWAFLFHGNLSLTSEIIKLVNQPKVKAFHCPTNNYKALDVSLWRVKGIEIHSGLKFE
jgi:hypothetical protein